MKITLNGSDTYAKINVSLKIGTDIVKIVGRSGGYKTPEALLDNISAINADQVKADLFNATGTFVPEKLVPVK